MRIKRRKYRTLAFAYKTAGLLWGLVHVCAVVGFLTDWTQPLLYAGIGLFSLLTVNDCTALVRCGAAESLTDARKKARTTIPSEKSIQAEILRYLNEAGFFWKDAAGPYQQRGIPDIVGVLHGRFCAFEVKRPLLGEATPLQERTIQRIQDKGGVAEVVTSVADVRAALEEAHLIPQKEAAR